MKRLIQGENLLLLLAFATLIGGGAFAQQSPTSPNAGEGPRLGGPQRSLDGSEGGATVQPRSGSGDISRGEQFEVLSAEGVTAAVPGARVFSLDAVAFDPIRDRQLEYGPLPASVQSATMSLAGPSPALEFLSNLSKVTNWNIVASPGVEEVTLNYYSQKMTPVQAAAILRFNDLFYRFDPEVNFLFVMTKDEYLSDEFGEIQRIDYDVRYANLSDMEVVLGALLSPKGRLIADPRTSKLIVFDVPENLRYMEQAAREVDVERASQTYELKNMNVEAIFDTVELLLSERGQMNLDPRTNLLVVYDRPERLKNIGDVLGQLDKKLETRSWVLQYADPAEVAEQLARLVPESMGAITVNQAIHQITVTATPWRLEDIDARITAWDSKRRQVQIEAYLATISTSAMRQLGFQWNLDTTISGNPFTADLGSALPDAIQTVTFDSNNLDVTLQALDTTGDATILAHPRITVQDGEIARFERATQVPFTQSTAQFGNSSNSNLNTVSTIDFIDVGTILSVLPRISQEDTILLDVEAEDSTFETVEFISNDTVTQAPQKTQSKASTQVLVRDGETLVLGGLRVSNSTNSNNRVPILGEVPVVGLLFRSTQRARDDAELLIFITPTIVGELTAPEADAVVQFDDRKAEMLWDDQKSTLERAMERVNGKQDEIRVAVGASGDVAVNGQRTSVGALRTSWLAEENPGRKTVVLRTHPRAPEEVSMQLMNSAMEAGMKLDFDDARFPSVPREAAPVEP